MPDVQLLLDDVPELSGETAIELLDFLHALTTAIENQYFAQIHAAREQPGPDPYDLFQTPLGADDFDDPLPNF